MLDIGNDRSVAVLVALVAEPPPAGQAGAVEPGEVAFDCRNRSD